jgi:hypothetical protein
VAVLNTIRPAAGVAMVETSDVPVNATRGGRNPLSVAEISSLALACGADVPIPTWAATIKGDINKKLRMCLHENMRQIFGPWIFKIKRLKNISAPVHFRGIWILDIHFLRISTKFLSGEHAHLRDAAVVTYFGCTMLLAVPREQRDGLNKLRQIPLLNEL